MGSHLVRRLLERGYRVRATVRSTASAPKVAPLRGMQGDHPGRLELFEADLLVDGSFDEAMEGCGVVFHVASPFFMPEKIKDGQRDMVEPALVGTRNVVGSVERTATVRRFVLTSTVGAVFGDYADVLGMEGQVLSETYFNTTSTVENNPYHYAKTVAEQAAWEAAKGQERWRMVAVNPGLVLGPSSSRLRVREPVPARGALQGLLLLRRPRLQLHHGRRQGSGRRAHRGGGESRRRTGGTSSRPSG